MEYIEIKNTDQLIETLRKFEKTEEPIVMHYHCDYCGDDQVTYEKFITEEDINDIIEDDYVMTNLECTNCYEVTKFISVEDIIGLESLE